MLKPLKDLESTLESGCNLDQYRVKSVIRQGVNLVKTDKFSVFLSPAPVILNGAQCFDYMLISQ